MKGTLKEVLISEIDPGKRFRHDENLNLLTLVPSLRLHGILQPITLLEKASVPGGVQHEKDPEAPYLLLAGGRRFYGSQVAGFTTMPASIRRLEELHMTPEELENAPKELIELKIREVELEENIQREDLNDLEKTQLTMEIHRNKQSLYGTSDDKRMKTDRPGWSIKDTANLLGRSVGAIHLDMDLAKAAEEDPEIAEALKISKSEAKRVQKAKERKKEATTARETVEKKKAETPEDKRKAALAHSYIIADFFEAIEEEAENSYGLIELDPPWSISLKDSYNAKTRNARPGDIDDFIDITPEEYEAKMGPALRRCFNLLTDSGWLFLWYGNKEDSMAQTVGEEGEELELVTLGQLNYRLLLEAGFKVAAMPNIWVKDLGAGFTRNPAYNLSYDYECFFAARKKSATIRQRGNSNVFPYRRVAGTKKIHRTEKPVELYQKIFSTHALVGTETLIGFAGSGNALLASSNLGAEAKGFDLSREFQTEYFLRVYKKEPGPYRSHEAGTAALFGQEG